MDHCIRKAVACVSPSNLLTQYMNSVKAQKAITISNGTDTSIFNTKTKFSKEKIGISEHNLVLGYAGSVGYGIRIDILVNSLKFLKKMTLPVKLLVVGDGTKLDELKKMLKQAGLVNDAILTGNVKHEDVPKYIQLMDIGTIPFITGPWSKFDRPLKLFEYLACGIPVICTDIPETKSLKNEYHELPIFFASDGKGFAKAFLSLTENGKHREKGKIAADLVRKKFSWDELVKQYEDLIKEVVESKKSSL